MQTINDIQKWELLTSEDKIEFPSDKPRPVRLELNVAGTALLYVLLKGEAHPRFLAMVTGRDTVRVAVPGAYALMTKTLDVDVFVLTDDNAKLHRNPVDEETYTTFHEPRAIDENYERILNAVNRNMNIRLSLERQAMRREFENELSARGTADVDSQSAQRDDGSKPSNPPAEPVDQPDVTDE